MAAVPSSSATRTSVLNGNAVAAIPQVVNWKRSVTEYFDSDQDSDATVADNKGVPVAIKRVQKGKSNRANRQHEIEKKRCCFGLS